MGIEGHAVLVCGGIAGIAGDLVAALGAAVPAVKQVARAARLRYVGQIDIVADLAGLRLVVLARISVDKGRFKRPACPDGIEGCRAGSSAAQIFFDHRFVPIIGSVSGLAGRPTHEVISVAGEGAFGQLYLLVKDRFDRLHRAAAAVGIEGDGIMVRLELRRVGDVRVDDRLLGQLVLSVVPAEEGVAGLGWVRREICAKGRTLLDLDWRLALAAFQRDRAGHSGERRGHQAEQQHSGEQERDDSFLHAFVLSIFVKSYM